MLVCLLFIGSIAAVGYVSLLLPDKLVLTRSLLIIAGGVTAAAGLVLCAVSGRGEGRAALIFFGAAIAVGCVIGSLYFGDYRNRIVQRFSGSDRSVTAVVGRVRYSSASYMIFDAQLSSIDGESCSLSATVKVRGAPGLRVGERFGMHADIAETEPYDGTALSLMYSASEGRFLTLSTDSLSIYGREPSGSLTARFARLRERVGQTLSLRLGDGAGLCRALLLGDRSELGDSISDDFSALGISHIVAVSGLHLGIITAVVSFLLRRLHVPNAPSIIVTAVFALLFAALTGFSSSVLRSALMLMIASSARMGGRSGHMPTSLASAVALIILFRPCAVLDVGLVLSFSSTFGIAVIGAPLCRRISERISRYTHDIRERFYSRSPSAMRGAISGLAVGMAEFALDSVIIGASANLLTAPLAFLFFGFSSLYSIPASRSQGFCCHSRPLHCCRHHLCLRLMPRRSWQVFQILFPALPPHARYLPMRWDRSARSPLPECCCMVCRLFFAVCPLSPMAATAADAEHCSRHSRSACSCLSEASRRSCCLLPPGRARHRARFDGSGRC